VGVLLRGLGVYSHEVKVLPHGLESPMDITSKGRWALQASGLGIVALGGWG
jgi:hypothetical protein